MTHKIVLVDDDEKIGELLGQSLKSRGHDVQIFSEPEAARDFFLSHEKYNVLISDNIMPKLNGSDLISHCLEIRKDVLYILATGDDSYNFSNFDNISNVKVISKPYKRKDIINSIGDYFKE